LAAAIQAGLLPPHNVVHSNWQADYHYEPAGPVSGDYCDLVSTEDGSLYFMLGDVSGKGIAASMLMAHLHAMFRALIGVGLPLERMVERASRVFCESTRASQYATLACGRAGTQGDVELCNAGHLPPLLRRGTEVKQIDATGLPLGLFCGEEFSIERVTLHKGDLLVLYTDGLTEGQDTSGAEFGVRPLVDLAKERRSCSAQELVKACVTRAADFRSRTSIRDDLSLMVIQRLD
jgi:sigma-B regulation protein RsbU (phosphoserine phosphatase)